MGLFFVVILIFFVCFGRGAFLRARRRSRCVGGVFTRRVGWL